MKIVFNYKDRSYEITNITYQEYDGKRRTTVIGYKDDYGESTWIIRHFHLTIDEAINEVKMNIREEYKNDK